MDTLNDIIAGLKWGNLDPIEAHDRVLHFFNVSKQREQLISFMNWYEDDPKGLSNNVTIVDAYLEEINCG